MHLFTYGWCLHTFFFRDKGEHHATPSELLWTLQLKRFRLQLEHYVFCDISPVRRNRKFESNVQLVGVVFGSLLCTTEASNVQANLPLFPH